MTEIDALLQREFESLFGPVARNQAATDNFPQPGRGLSAWR